MSFRTIEELREFLSSRRLLGEAAFNDAIVGLPMDQCYPKSVISLLGDKHLLTPHQVTTLLDGDRDSLLLGNYKPLYLNAAGSFARVYRGESIRDGSVVAIKVLREKWSDDPEMVKQFREEAKLCQKLDHPNIVKIFEVGSQGKIHFFTMPFIEGGNLREFLAIRKQLSQEEASRYALDIARGLQFALDRGMPHQDLKATNVLLSTRGIAKLVDFGLAALDQRAVEYATLEAGTNAPRSDPRSDLFFLGALYYEMLSGVSPFGAAKTKEQRRRFSRYHNIRPLRVHVSGLHRPVERIVERLMHLSPNERYQIPGDAVDDLEEVLKYLTGSKEMSVHERESEGTSEKRAPIVLCIESRSDKQDLLRQYLSKRGFKTLVVRDLQRGWERCRAESDAQPDCLLLMAPDYDEEAVAVCREAFFEGTRRAFCSVTVLAREQEDWIERMDTSPKNVILTQPVKLRDVGAALIEVLKNRKHSL